MLTRHYDKRRMGKFIVLKLILQTAATISDKVQNMFNGRKAQLSCCFRAGG